MHVLVDTSVWFQHFRDPDAVLLDLLARNAVVVHTIVIGEIAVGGVRNRDVILADLHALPGVIEYAPKYCLRYLESKRLYGLGIGWCDLQLLVSADHCAIPIWTFDTRMAVQAAALGLAWTPP
jgi:predicted nucleic acid-binding protein